jgi:catechol 2,3-dioxygenase-like lactoylglutathione lyase family enzyme
MHVSVAVRDIETTSRTFARLFHLPPPAIYAGTIADGSTTGSLLVGSLRFPNFFVEFLQPVDGSSPYDVFVREHGNGIHHLGFHVENGNLNEHVAWLQRHGGLYVGGGETFANVDFKAILGTTLEVLTPIESEWDPALSIHASESPATLGGQLITHIGIVVRDARLAARGYAAIFGVEEPPVHVAAPHFPRHAKVSGEAHARVATVRQRSLVLQFIEPVGRSPLRDYLDEHGNAVHHIGFNVRRQLDVIVAALQAEGGRRVLGQRGDPYAQIDFSSQCGLIIELTGQPSA